MEKSTIATTSPQLGVIVHQSTPTHSAAPRHVDESFISRYRSHLLEPVRPSILAEIELIILTFCTGIQDAISFPDYHCFTSNQTGNTVFLMLALVIRDMDGEMFITANIGAALGFFLGAGCLTGQLSHLIGPRRKWWLIFSNFFQTCLVFAAAAIQYQYGTATKGPVAVTVISLMAFASGSQVVQSRSLAMTEISTAMATAAWVDLIIDPCILAKKNRPRNRRIFFLMALFLGSIVGAGMYKTVGSAAGLFFSACGKLLVTLMYLFNGTEKPKEIDLENSCASTCMTVDPDEDET